MRGTLFTIVFIYFSLAFAQWRVLDAETVTRYDDIFFINESVGWAVGGGARTILKTTDGGQSWNQKFLANAYLRSIEFISTNVGFVGSLEGHLLQTLDGGETWTDISDRLPHSVPGICGIAAPSTNVIYATGRWAGDFPAFVIKSTDGGQTWSYQDMSALATQLVEICFLDENNGMAAGMANPRSEGGIILKTADGGQTWEVVHKTMTDRDYVWKIQTPDSVNFYGSIQSLPTTENVRYVKSMNAGANWTTETIDESSWNYMQMIGFSDPQNGWTGGTANGANGETKLYRTTDGGLSWSVYQDIRSDFKTFNRFFMLNRETIFMTGRGLYKYDPTLTGTLSQTILHSPEDHILRVFPNPVSDIIRIEANLYRSTTMLLELFDDGGKLVWELTRVHQNAGNHRFDINSSRLPAGTYFLCLHTNENMYYRKIIKN